MAHAVRCGESKCTPVVRQGHPAPEIAAAARASGAALIVVGLGPHHVTDRALGGETALQLVQQATAPVLAVPESATELPRRAVAAIDFTPTSLRAAETTARLLAPDDVLRLVHVRAPDEPRAIFAIDTDVPAASRNAEERLAQLAATVAVPRGVKVEQAVVSGSPARALLDEVARAHADLIALGSHGYGLWKRLTIGSVASKVLRLATTFVLVQPLGSLARPV